MPSDINILPFTLPGNVSVKRPLIVAGPCSAETEKQVLDTAGALKSMGVDVFRAGVWKPRTRPGDFEGRGLEALAWLKRVKEETGMLITTEVATESHVREAIRNEVDILWIGTRTTASPFAVETIANALEGVDIPVMVKNPIHPELSMWRGAIERFVKHGVTNIAAVHRGFSIYSKNRFRYPPQWEIPLELKKQLPGITIIHDPSHISGNRKLIYRLIKKASRLHFDGIMIEVHPKPDVAWTDPRQQITPEAFNELINKKPFRSFC
ncbi:MAG: 3-deoxy-7-phosphoheptulonate synthase [Bacteroidales bacterium]|nr:3-deoxy-7-phosphoheptulonate synthase [Bacteroidales bacterium]